jgi:nucleoside-diphosphate-sugar epimerase
VERLFRDAPHLLGGVQWAEGDVLDIFSLDEALRGVDTVYHCAAFVSYVPAEAGRMLQVNMEGTANLVNACLARGGVKFCHASSVAALGQEQGGVPMHEDLPWKVSSGNSRYAVSKYGAEREVWRGHAEGLCAVIVNPGIIVGPGDWRRSSDAIFRRVWNGLRYYTEGMTGWVDVRDVVRCMTGLVEKELWGRRYVVTAENLPYRTVIDWVADDLRKPRPAMHAGPLLRSIVWRMEAVRCRLSGSRPLITRETARAAGRTVRYDNAKIREALGIDFIPVREAVRRTCAFFLEDPESGKTP